MNPPALDIAKDNFRRSPAARREAARMPIEEKLAILISLQRHASGIRRASGRPEMLVWQLD